MPVRGEATRKVTPVIMKTPPNNRVYRDPGDALRDAEAVLADRLWPGLVNGAPQGGAGHGPFLALRSDYEDRGWVSFTGLSYQGRETLGRYVLARVRVPEMLAGKAARLSVRLSASPRNLVSCPEARLRLTVRGGGRTLEALDGTFEARVRIPEGLTSDGSAEVLMELPEAYAGGGPDYDRGCSAVLETLEVKGMTDQPALSQSACLRRPS
jgi:hypothetical protein